MFIEVHGKNYVSRFAKTILNLKRYTIWNGGNSSISQKKTEHFFLYELCKSLYKKKKKFMSITRSPVRWLLIKRCFCRVRDK